jgi:limonene-1,2-epoxide hydrolase
MKNLQKLQATFETADITAKIKELISMCGVWYCNPTWTIQTPAEFIASVGRENISQELNDLLIHRVCRIQRQCDSYAIELN